MIRHRYRGVATRIVCEGCGATVADRAEARARGWGSVADMFWFWSHYCARCLLGRQREGETAHGQG